MGAEAPERSIVGPGRPARRGDSRDSEAGVWGVDPSCAPQDRALDPLASRVGGILLKLSDRPLNPYSARRRVLPAGAAGSSCPAGHRICAQVCLFLGLKSGSGRPWEFVFVSPPPWGLAHLGTQATFAP